MVSVWERSRPRILPGLRRDRLRVDEPTASPPGRSTSASGVRRPASGVRRPGNRRRSVAHVGAITLPRTGVMWKEMRLFGGRGSRPGFRVALAVAGGILLGLLLLAHCRPARPAAPAVVRRTALRHHGHGRQPRSRSRAPAGLGRRRGARRSEPHRRTVLPCRQGGGRPAVDRGLGRSGRRGPRSRRSRPDRGAPGGRQLEPPGRRARRAARAGLERPVCRPRRARAGPRPDVARCWRREAPAVPIGGSRCATGHRLAGRRRPASPSACPR